ncbi:MAG: NAD(P)-dependent alcohol dehydrogenase [Deltaproteobacteria bacterium]|nr:NAD(P)-dependent alcohol dehydrogenase [Deltaproteobacteria bacterium]
MKAAVYRQYGPPEVVRLEEVEKPVPGPGEILIRVRATTVSSGDHRARGLDLPAGFGPAGRLMFGLRGPRQPILGSVAAGDVEAVGQGVQGFGAGDAVLAFPDVKLGCHAEYRCMPAGGAVVPRPPGFGHEEAAALPFGGMAALQFLRRARLVRGEKVLVNGASGEVGVACVQLARHLDAEVTAVCSGANAELVRSLGAAQVVDYTRDDFTAGGRTWDVIVDTAGTSPLSRCRGALASGGRLVLVLASAGAMLRSPWDSLVSGRKVIVGVSSGNREDLEALARLAEAGDLAPVIGRRFTLEQIVQAHRHVASGHKRGSAVVTVP